RPQLDGGSNPKARGGESRPVRVCVTAIKDCLCGRDGQLLIQSAGGGYYVLVAGVERVSVDLGQFVATGEPVVVREADRSYPRPGRPGPSNLYSYAGSGQDGIPIDSSPGGQQTKVRG